MAGHYKIILVIVVGLLLFAFRDSILKSIGSGPTAPAASSSDVTADPPSVPVSRIGEVGAASQMSRDASSGGSAPSAAATTDRARRMLDGGKSE